VVLDEKERGEEINNKGKRKAMNNRRKNEVCSLASKEQ